MKEPGLFDVQARFEDIQQAQRPLARLKASIQWEEFRPTVQKIYDKPRKSNAGRKPLDAVMMFKALILQSLYNLSDEELEFHIRDRFSFLDFLDLRLCDGAPDRTTIWSFREALKSAGLLEELFAKFEQQLLRAGYTAKSGQIIDASIVPAPRHRSTQEQREQLQAGQVPQEWQEPPARLAQKDVDARWTRKNHVTSFGYKNHISVDVEHGFIRRFAVTDAATHDSRPVPQLLDEHNTDPAVYADAAYSTQTNLDLLRERGYEDRLARQGRRNHPLPPEQRRRNGQLAKIRSRVEHVFAAQLQLAKTLLVRTIGLQRAELKIGLRNLTYNFRRYEHLLRKSCGQPQVVECEGM